MSTSVALPSSKRKIIRQLALMVTLQKPAKSPFSGCSRNPGSHVAGPCSAIQKRQDADDLIDVPGIQTAPVVIRIKPPQFAMAKAQDHSSSKCKVTIVPCQHTSADSANQNGLEFSLQYGCGYPQMAFQVLLSIGTHLRKVR